MGTGAGSGGGGDAASDAASDAGRPDVDPTVTEAAPTRADRIAHVALFGYIAATIGGAVAAVALTAPGDTATRAQVLVFVVLIVTSSAYDVVARRIERVRRRTSVGPFFTMNSVWTFCAAVVLPAWLAAIVGAFVFVQEEVQARLADNPKPVYRVMFNISAVALPVVAVHHLTDWPRLLDLDGTAASLELPAALLCGIVLYAAVNAVLVSGVIVLASRSLGALRTALGTPGDNLLELATLSLGGLLALAVWHGAALIVLALPILVMLQRIALVDHLESAASSDSKTGLLNASAWNHMAERELVRASARETPCAVMIIDLDHFKQVNDVYGHLSGDAVLKAVADCMARVLRDRDLLSRFGGEEFVALLPDLDAEAAQRVAERLRVRIAEVVVEHRGDPTTSVTRVGGETFGAVDTPEQIQVTVSIGVASYPRHGEELTSLLAKADSALYDAKRSGRNRVHTSV